MPGDLTSVTAKLDRASHHLGSFRDEAARYIGSKPYLPAADFDADRGGYVVRSVSVCQPDPCLALIVGDIAYNLRSSLDHLAWELVIANGKKPSKATAFPICTKRPTKNGKTVEVNVKGVSAKALALIRGMQPYNVPPQAPPQNNMFHVLDSLCNVDKHRHLHLVGGRVVDPFIVLTDASGVSIHSGERKVHEFFPLEDDTEIGFVPAAGPLEAPLQVDCVSTFFVTIKEPKIQLPADALLAGWDLGTLLNSFLESLRNAWVPLFEPFMK